MTSNQIIWEDDVRKLFLDGDTPKLIYKGVEYTFGGHGYEPLAIIFGKDGEVAYIHNCFEWQIDELENKMSGWKL